MHTTASMDTLPLWRPSARLEVLRTRAALLARVRGFFAEAGVLEVDTPVLSRAGASDPALSSLTLQTHNGNVFYLHTSPEFPMKRLLASGSGPIYQICKVFRDDERGRLHHPEFSMLEWYRPGWDHLRLIDEVAELVRIALERPELPLERLSYRELFTQRLSVDPWSASLDVLRAVAINAGIGGVESLELERDAWLDLLLSHCLEPQLGRGCLTFIHDYPPSQAALAQVRADDPPVAERFELYLEGVELANGFRELIDAHEQRARFLADLATRESRGQHCPPLDERLLAALESGLPESAGVALGLDRLLMIATGARHIDEVLAFPVERA